MRISDWSSDVCSSDLPHCQSTFGQVHHRGPTFRQRAAPFPFPLIGTEEPESGITRTDAAGAYDGKAGPRPRTADRISCQGNHGGLAVSGTRPLNGVMTHASFPALRMRRTRAAAWSREIGRAH